MLWSSTLVKLDNVCPRQSYWRRLGKTGRRWAGFAVGSWVHDALHAVLLGQTEPPIGHLSAIQMAAARTFVANASKHGWLARVPSDAIVEQSYARRIERDELGRWRAAPEWAVRGEAWDPARVRDYTAVRVQPDLAWTDREGTVHLPDWKTGFDVPDAASLAKTPQAIMYAAWAAEFLLEDDCLGVEFSHWNLRWNKEVRCAASGKQWKERAAGLWRGMFERDAVAGERLEADFRPGEHCGQCPYAAECLTEHTGDLIEGIYTQDDGALYQAVQALDVVHKLAKAALKKRLSARTSVLELEDGTLLGKGLSETHRFKKGQKGVVLKLVAEAVREKGAESLADYLTPSGGLGAWATKLHKDLGLDISEHLNTFTRTYVVHKKDDTPDE